MHWCILQKVSNINNLAFSIKSSKQATRKKSFRRTYKSKKDGNMKILAFRAEVYWILTLMHWATQVYISKAWRKKKRRLEFSFGLWASSSHILLARDLFLLVVVNDLVNPLGPKSDQHQFSPNNISRSSRVKVMRITKLITKWRILWS